MLANVGVLVHVDDAQAGHADEAPWPPPCFGPSGPTKPLRRPPSARCNEVLAGAIDPPNPTARHGANASLPKRPSSARGDFARTRARLKHAGVTRSIPSGGAMYKQGACVNRGWWAPGPTIVGSHARPARRPVRTSAGYNRVSVDIPYRRKFDTNIIRALTTVELRVVDNGCSDHGRCRD